jgi:hypothetical protein
MNPKEKLIPHYCGICKADILDFEGNAPFHLQIHEWMKEKILKQGLNLHD